MTTRAEVKAVLLSVEKANGAIAYLDQSPAKVSREELRVLIEAAKKAPYSIRPNTNDADCNYFL